MLRERSFDILHAAVRAFIKGGQAVSSEELYDAYDFGIKPASIRGELACLTREGFLAQPHTSGGRVPTEKGYRFIVDALLQKLFEGECIEGGDNSQSKKLMHTLEREPLDRFVAEFAEESDCMGCVIKEGRIYKNGFDMLCERIEFGGQNEFVELVRDIERLERVGPTLYNEQKNEDYPQVFIGKLSPVTESPHIAIIVNEYMIDGSNIVIMAVGPKRMDYEKPLRAFQAIGKKYKKIKKIRDKK